MVENLPKGFFPGAKGECFEDPSEGVKLQLGCGSKLWPGYINVDFVGGDIESDLRNLPFADDFADLIISVHVLEHFYRWEADEVVSEWRRVLKPGGKIIFELPCMDKILTYIAERVTKGIPMDARMTWLALWGDPKYEAPQMCHKWGYTKDLARELLTDAGFINIAFEKPRYHAIQRDMRIVGYKGE